MMTFTVHKDAGIDYDGAEIKEINKTLDTPFDPYPTTKKNKYESLGLAIRAVIESCFSETKEDIQDRAWHLIMELIYSNKN